MADVIECRPTNTILKNTQVLWVIQNVGKNSDDIMMSEYWYVQAYMYLSILQRIKTLKLDRSLNPISVAYLYFL